MAQQHTRKEELAQLAKESISPKHILLKIDSGQDGAVQETQHFNKNLTCEKRCDTFARKRC